MNTTSTLARTSVPAMHTTPEAFVAATLRGTNYNLARTARLLGRQCARENWTFDFRMEVEMLLGECSTIFYSTFDKFSRDNKFIVTVGTTDDQGFLNILQSDPAGEISDTWIYPRPERLIDRGWSFGPAFTECENENCRANCCK